MKTDPHVTPAVAPEAELSEIRVLAVDDDPDVLDLFAGALAKESVRLITATSAEEGLRIFAEEEPHIVILDRILPDMDGMEILEKMMERDPGVEVVMITGAYTADSAVQAIRLGAADYLPKPVSIEKLRTTIRNLAEGARERHSVHSYEKGLINAFSFHGMVGRSPMMLDIFATLRRIAPHYRSALITGETGTGKELVARALHELSPVAKGPFVVCNASAIVETLFESELFGHVKGAFTGAVSDRIGMFEAANKGTIFLDEIGEMPLTTQAKLLRVLQNHEVQRVGSPTARKIDVRVIAATNRSLPVHIENKQFREDLYYRLSMVEVALPSLRERKEDLPLLQRHFIESFAQQYGKQIRGITRRAQTMLSRYHWPGNIREMENVIGNACMHTDGSYVDVQHFPERLRNRPEQAAEPASGEMITLDDAIYRHVKMVVDKLNGNKLRAAEVLKISRSTLYRILGDKVAGEKDSEAAV